MGAAESSERKSKEQLLHNMFRELDSNGNGWLDQGEFHKMFEDPVLKFQLCEITGLNEGHLREVYQYLSQSTDGPANEERGVRYEEFVQRLYEQGQPACQRNVFRLEEKLLSIEKRNEERYDYVIQLLQEFLPAPAPRPPSPDRR